MTREANELLQKALTLPERERAEMAGTLIGSLDPAIDENVEQAWQEEVARRIADLESGKVKAIPWESICREARAILDGKANR